MKPLIILLLLSGNIYATEPRHAKSDRVPTVRSSTASISGSSSTAASKSRASAKSASQSKSVATGGQSKATGGTSSSVAKGGGGGSVGSVSGGSVGNVTAGSATSGNSIATNGPVESASEIGDINIRGDNSPRQAPAITVIPPMNTAECLTGIGFGGSNKSGSVALSPSWMQKDCLAMKQFELFANLGMPEAASIAFCSRKTLWFPFESKDRCRAMLTQSLLAMQVDRVEVPEVKKSLPLTSPLQGWLNETDKQPRY